MLRMMSDIVPALIACADGQLKNFSLRWFDDAALTVIMATKGYPGDYGKGSVHRRARRGRQGRGRRDLPCRHGREGRPDRRQWRARAERLRDRQDRHRGAASAPTRRSTDPLAGRLLPPRHRLAGSGAGKGGMISRIVPDDECCAPSGPWMKVRSNRRRRRLRWYHARGTP